MVSLAFCESCGNPARLPQARCVPPSMPLLSRVIPTPCGIAHRLAKLRMTGPVHPNFVPTATARSDFAATISLLTIPGPPNSLWMATATRSAGGVPGSLRRARFRWTGRSTCGATGANAAAGVRPRPTLKDLAPARRLMAPGGGSVLDVPTGRTRSAGALRRRIRLRRLSLVIGPRKGSVMPGILLVAVGLIVVHETGHIVATVRSGDRFLGLVFHGFAVGVKLDVTPLSAGQRVWSQAAGPLADGAAALTLVVAALLSLVSLHLVP